MRPYIAFILLILSQSAKAQISAEGQKFVAAFFAQERKETKYFYAQGVGSTTINELSKTINNLPKNTIKSWDRSGGRARLIDSLVLTDDEKYYILTELAAQKADSLWKNITLPGARMVPKQTILEIFNNKNKGWSYFHDGIGKGFYMFTFPIFFRNNNYCAFYYGYSCGNLCGDGAFIIYKKVNGKWRAAFKLYEWVS